MAASRKKNARDCARLQLGRFRPTLNPLATNFALAAVAAAGEPWPGEGRPMHYICQLNLTEAPFISPALADVALLTSFVADFECFIATGCAPDTWCLRAYPALDGLVPLARPQGIAAPEKLKREQRPRGFEGRWSKATDHPLYDDPDREDSDDEPDADHIYATKLGGYPSNLQHAVEWPGGDFAYVLQIDSEAKVGLSWADRGIVYVGRGIADRSRWAVSCQFY